MLNKYRYVVLWMLDNEHTDADGDQGQDLDDPGVLGSHQRG